MVRLPIRAMNLVRKTRRRSEDPCHSLGITVVGHSADSWPDGDVISFVNHLSKLVLRTYCPRHSAIVLTIDFPLCFQLPIDRPQRQFPQTAMEEHQFFGGDWRTRSPDADQEYFIDKMRMLKIKLRKYEDVSGFTLVAFANGIDSNLFFQENRLLYRCLAERKTDVKEALRDKCLVINNVQYEMSELKKHILMLLGVLSEDCDATLVASPVPTTSQEQQQPQPPPQCHQSEMDKTIWLTRNKSLEENFKKALKKVKELERQVGQLTETVEELNKDREDLIEKNSFIEEENNIQREQIALLEDTVKDLEVRREITI